MSPKWHDLAVRILLLAGCLFLTDLPQLRAADNAFTETDCWFEPPDPNKVSCDILTVPGDHFNETGTHFELPLIRMRPTRISGSRPPLVYLSGGPGEPSYIKSWENVEGWLNFASNILFGRELVIMELRGSQLSRPSLDCPELNDPAVVLGVVPAGQNNTASIPDTTRSEQTCLNRFVEAGIGPDSVNRHQIAEDIKMLADGLGARKLSLYSVSYGTTYAMTIMETYPELVAEAVLDSVYPPEATSDIKHTLMLDHTLGKYFIACRNDVACNSAYPDMEDQFYHAVDQLERHPVTVTFTDMSDGERKSLVMDAALYLTALRNM